MVWEGQLHIERIKVFKKLEHSKKYLDCRNRIICIIEFNEPLAYVWVDRPKNSHSYPCFPVTKLDIQDFKSSHSLVVSPKELITSKFEGMRDDRIKQIQGMFI